MGEGFGTQPGDLEAAAGRFDEAARAVTDAVDSLRAALGGLGDYAGSDEQGRAFKAEYDPKLAEGLAAMSKEADAVRSLGEALRSSARDYASGDQANASGLRPPGG